MAFDWEAFSKGLGETGRLLQTGILRKEEEKQLLARQKELMAEKDRLQRERIEWQTQYTANLKRFLGDPELEKIFNKAITSGEPFQQMGAMAIQQEISKGIRGEDMNMQVFEVLSPLKRTSIDSLYRENIDRQRQYQQEQDRTALQALRIEASLTRGREDIEKPEVEALGVEDKKRLSTHQNMLKNAQSRLSKERTTLISASKPSPNELITGMLPEQKKRAAAQLGNVEEAIDFLSKMENYIADGTPLGKRQVAALKKIREDISRIRTGETVEGIRASWMKEAGIDEFGFSMGEQKEDEEGNPWEYIGNNQWRQVR